MGAADFRVQTGELQALASQLSALAGELSTAGHTTPDSGAAGHADVETAMTDFVSHWNSQMQQAENLLNQVSARLQSAGHSYAATDSGVSSGFGGG